jgi:hypothetical protein
MMSNYKLLSEEELDPEPQVLTAKAVFYLAPVTKTRIISIRGGHFKQNLPQERDIAAVKGQTQLIQLNGHVNT